MRRTIFCALLLKVVDTNAQPIIYPVSSPYITVAQIGSQVTNGLTCIHNPATLACLNGLSLAVSSEKRFLSKELNLLTIAAAFKQGTNGLSVWYTYFGSSLYNENAIGLNYGISLGKLKLGSIFKYQQCRNRGNAFSFFEYGVASVLQVADNVFAGIRILNPALIKSKNEHKIRGPSASSFTIGVEVSDNVYVGGEVEKTEGVPPGLTLFIQYRFSDKYYSKAQWNSLNQQPYFAVGWRAGKPAIEIGSGFHPVLGVSPMITLIYQKKTSSE